MKVHHRRLRLDIRKTFTQRVLRHWNSVLKEVVMASDPPDFNNCLDNTLRHMACDSCSCSVHSQELDFCVSPPAQDGL